MTNLVRSTQYPLLGIDVFDDIFTLFFQEAPHVKEASGFPPVMMKETENELFFQFALAGFTEEDLNVTVEGSTISVKGQKSQDDTNLFASRAFTWSRKDAYGVWDLEKSNITFKNGLLSIKISKKESAQPKTLMISGK